jgi:hypothetical protein
LLTACFRIQRSYWRCIIVSTFHRDRNNTSSVRVCLVMECNGTVPHPDSIPVSGSREERNQFWEK